MTLEGSIPAIIFFILFIIIALAASYLYGWKMIEMTGFFASQAVIASIINLFLWACAVFGWFLYTTGISEELFFGGLVLMGVLLVISEASLIIMLFLQRDKFIIHRREDSHFNFKKGDSPK
ncbi:hypothetical protein [Lentibacillus amyloliquefaciens]|uniref:Uncharacterized protein n=1 Tax=Lentibacillus amyloliquefaciens TaxID=1472767 RepID=A0A0U4E9Q1_9BACI|nr:hypothetical protein [Lentibacillus amyloliquefaciens]ALX49617.1 hypothetical protein AOX59_14205 [Lentibacillus amyloliquefaciens]